MNQRSEDKPQSSQPRASPYRTQSPKGKGKGKNKSKQVSHKLPTVVLEGGCRATTNKGDPICFGYNLGTCNLSVNTG